MLQRETIQRAVTLTNGGSPDWASATLTTTAPTSSPLDGNAANGLQMVLDRCSTAWTEAVTPVGSHTYTCGGTRSTLVDSRPVIGADIALGSLASLTAGGPDHLRVTLMLPHNAGDAFQGATSVLRFSFDGTQRAATKG